MIEKQPTDRELRKNIALRAGLAAAVEYLAVKAVELGGSVDRFEAGTADGIELALQTLHEFTHGEVGRDFMDAE